MPVIGMMLRNASVTSFSCLLVVKLPCLYNVPFETNRPPDRFGDWSAEQRQCFFYALQICAGKIMVICSSEVFCLYVDVLLHLPGVILRFGIEE